MTLKPFDLVGVNGRSRRIALLRIPNQRLFSTSQAARYLGISADTLRKYADLGRLKARQLERRRVFTLEELDEFVEALPAYEHPGYAVGGGKPGGKE